MKKIAACCAILGIILLCLGNANALEVRITRDKLSVRANQDPLQSILERMADIGITVRIDPRLNPKISASFEERDIKEGLDSILKSLDHVLIWEFIKGPLGPIPKLAEIHVFEPGRKDLMRPLVTRSTLPIAIDPGDGSLFVKDEILVRLRKGISLKEFEELLRQIGGIVVDSNAAVGIYKIRLPQDTDVRSIIEKIGNHPGIARAEPDYAYPISASYKSRSPAPSNAAFSNTSGLVDGEPIAVLDTGLSPESGLGPLVLSSLDSLNPDGQLSDSLGHGTQMALIASGIVTPDGAGTASDELTPLIAIRAFDDNGFTSDFHIMRSIDFAIDNGARIMSLSWGSETRSEFLEKYLEYASSRGLFIIAAAGNEPTGRPVYPAAYPSVQGIGALDPDGKPWVKSNYGDFVKLYAPGFATLPVGYKGDPGIYAGTSISTAFVANFIANYLDKNPKATTQEVLDAVSGRFSISD
jgi:thermitase